MKAYNFKFNTIVETTGTVKMWDCIALVKKSNGCYKIKTNINKDIEDVNNNTYTVKADNEYNAIKTHVINNFKEVNHVVKIDSDKIYITQIKL